mmetsp:Transcript_24260/g.52812  ORF Transcript_24260/g.52812 Transcript_24260/m.52812 type:complete len:666 (-) Transcript_24260:422-2419(-)|eukprot:CAMPEP_0206441522 /NCGR_PEP_ID=MMETSP0324_2-20121206/13328_1 /ASSEMBLY_ACC=CAM_ASM_000836 /TAXON_ID=2866 /ORGANISM="Crypthecodinium cohnii, Strain Seligo" /LENGTH=665 /DNA_ID=CAMNT_0053909293 /DNA_START=22 /DNA_END=2019 /DNA_ORIENTATION=+
MVNEQWLRLFQCPARKAPHAAAPFIVEVEGSTLVANSVAAEHDEAEWETDIESPDGSMIHASSHSTRGDCSASTSAVASPALGPSPDPKLVDVEGPCSVAAHVVARVQGAAFEDEDKDKDVGAREEASAASGPQAAGEDVEAATPSPFLASLCGLDAEKGEPMICSQEIHRRTLALHFVCERLSKMAVSNRPTSAKAFENATRGSRTVRTYTVKVEAVLAALPSEDVALFEPGMLLDEVKARCALGGKHCSESPSEEQLVRVAKRWQAQRVSVLKQGIQGVAQWVQAQCCIERAYSAEDILSALRHFSVLQGSSDYGRGLVGNFALRLPSPEYVPVVPGTERAFNKVVLLYKIHVPPGGIATFMGHGGSGIKATKSAFAAALAPTLLIRPEVFLAAHSTKTEFGKFLGSQPVTIAVSVWVSLVKVTRVEQSQELKPVDTAARAFIAKLQQELNMEYLAKHKSRNSRAAAIKDDQLEQGREYQKEQKALRFQKKAAKKDNVQAALRAVKVPTEPEPWERLSPVTYSTLLTSKQVNIQTYERRARNRRNERREALLRSYAKLPEASPDHSLEGLLTTIETNKKHSKQTKLGGDVRRLLGRLATLRGVEDAGEAVMEEIEKVKKVQFVRTPKAKSRQSKQRGLPCTSEQKRRELIKVDYEPTAYDFAF